MEKDNAVRNQKVFVRLTALLDFQKRYLLVAHNEKETKGAITPNDRATHLSYLTSKRTLEQVIDMLELPIEKI